MENVKIRVGNDYLADASTYVDHIEKDQKEPFLKIMDALKGKHLYTAKMILRQVENYIEGTSKVIGLSS